MLKKIEFTEEDIHFTIDVFGYKLLKYDSFEYVAKIIAEDSKFNEPSGFSIEVGLNNDKNLDKIDNSIKLLKKPDSDDILSEIKKISIEDLKPIKSIDEVVINVIKIVEKEADLLDDAETFSRLCQFKDNDEDYDRIIGGGWLSSKKKGTLGAVFKTEEKYYGITSGHILGELNSNVNYSIGKINGNINWKPIGNVIFKKNSVSNDYFIDYGIICICKNNNITSGLLSNLTITNQPSQAKTNDPVIMYGAYSNGKNGIIQTNYRKDKIKDKLSSKFYVIEAVKGCAKFSDGGDSGSIVIDKYNNPIGIVKGRHYTNKRSKIIPLENIKKDMKKNTSTEKLILNFNF